MMICVIALTIALIVGGFLVGAYFLHYFEISGYYAAKVPFLGAFIGGSISAVLWRLLLKFYKYTTDLKPIIED